MAAKPEHKDRTDFESSSSISSFEEVGRQADIFPWKRVGAGAESCFTVLWNEEGGYRREALEYGACPGLLPTSFIEESGELTAYYEDTEHLTLIQRYNQLHRSGESLLRFTVELLRRLAEAERESDDFLLNRDSIRYRPDCIFIHPKSGEVKMAYIPETGSRTFSQRISDLLNELCFLYPESGLELLKERLEKELSEGALGTGELLRRFSRWEREV